MGGSMKWIRLIHEKGDQWRALLNTVMNFLFPRKAGYFLTS